MAITHSSFLACPAGTFASYRAGCDLRAVLSPLPLLHSVTVLFESGNDVTAGYPEGARVLVPVGEDTVEPFPQLLDLAEPLQDGNAGDRHGMVARLRLEILVHRRRAEREGVLLQFDRESMGPEE